MKKEYDIFILGATPAGIACGIRAAREGKKVVIANHGRHIGGFMTSGAGGWEAPYDGTRSPILTEVQQRITDHYRKTYGDGSSQHLASIPSSDNRKHMGRRKVESCVVERIFEEMLTEQQLISIMRNFDLSKVSRLNESISSVTLASNEGGEECEIKAHIYVDCTYEGDLAALAGVPCRIGRESREEYGEPHAGRIFTRHSHNDGGKLSWPIDAAEGRLNMRSFSHASEEIILPESTGEEDSCVMAYNCRLVLCSNPENRVPISRPANYNPDFVRHLPAMSIVRDLPNSKIAWNAGRLIGPQSAYPEGDWKTREQISRTYLDGILSQLWFLQNDPSVEPKTREYFRNFGLPKDEFVDNGHLPYEVYVREARRIVGQYIFTEQDAILKTGEMRTPIHADSIGMTDWPLDSVACTSAEMEGRNDGAFFMSISSRPAQIPYRCLLPKNCDNLLVPVCISASHVGFGAIRLEPVWMQLGEAAGFAAAISIDSGTHPAAIEIPRLKRRLVEKGFCISFFNDIDSASSEAWAAPIQYLGTLGFFDSYDARPRDMLDRKTMEDWNCRCRKLSPKACSVTGEITRGDAAILIYEGLNMGNS
ncbi:MAG TPA: pyridine nucleotide-disulfide oxidoreductase [Lentisphaeria bacterium]|nr:MAG: hypothetical protein A2X48_21125 [Lentisphaerae bacterium GWF2_49_21]HBC88656.1 pyridine nucleotide-disulfide oxidoreductase [Lentisphaeria bacterium]